MMIVHAPPWVALCGLGLCGGDRFDALGCLTLTISQLFFLLKLADPPWLRLVRGRRMWITMTLSVALLHTGAVQQLLLNEAAAARADMALPIAAEFPAVVAGFACVLRRVEGIRPSSARSQRRPALGLVYARVLQPYPPLRFLLLARSCAVSRAPPC